MTTEQLSNLFLRWGWYIFPDQQENFKKFFREMLRRDRVMVITNDGNVEAVIFYFLTNDYKKLYKKGLWDTPEDEPKGSQIYIDKMICREWTHTLRRQIQDVIENHFPNVEEGYYHREPFDRLTKIKARRRVCIT